MTQYNDKRICFNLTGRYLTGERESWYYEWTTPIFDGLEPVLAIMAVELAWHVDGIEAALAFVDSDVMAPLSLGIGRRIAALKHEPGPGFGLGIGIAIFSDAVSSIPWPEGGNR